MGYQDRDYYRDGKRGSSFLSGTAPACKAIIGLNVGLWVFGLLFNRGDRTLEDLFAATSVDIFEKGQLWRLVTATFLHDPTNLLHLVFNMLFLWMVGREMEAFYGTREFWWLYLSAGAFATLCWAAVNYFTGSRLGLTIGASGAVMAVVALYTFYYPTREVIFFIFPMPMWLLLTLYVGNDALQLLGRSHQPIAFAAHLGGVAYGWMFKVLDLRLKRLGAYLPRRGPRLRVVSADPPSRSSEAPAPRVPAGTGSTRSPAPAATATRPAPPVVVSEELLDAKLDEILGKIASQGQAAVTEEDRRILDEASRRARNRRNGRA